MARTWQSSDGTISQPEGGTPEWSAHLRSHLKRVTDSHGPVSVVDLQPFDVKEHPLPHNEVKSQYYRRLLQDGQPTLPIVVHERPEGGYTLVDGIHRLGAHQLLNKPLKALLIAHSLQKMAIKDVRLGRRIPVAPGHFLGYTRYDYSHVLPSTMTSQGYRLNVYHDPSDPSEERFVTSILTHPNAETTSANFPHSVGSVSGHLQPNGEFKVGTAHINEMHRGGKGLPMYEALLAHASKKLGAHTVVGGEHSTMAHKVHQKLALKHGMDYNHETVVQPPRPEGMPPATGPYDGQYGDYKYAIKGEEEMAKAIGPFIASMMMAAHPGEMPDQAAQPKHEIAQTMYKPWTPEGLHEDLVPIAHLESSWGKNIAHGQGKNEMDTAFGALGFKPQTAMEEYARSKQLQKQHPGLNDPQSFLQNFRGDPGFYNKIASEHFARLKRLHGTAEKAAYAWRHGSTAAANATPEDVDAEPYVQKYKALKSVKKLGKSQRDKESVRVVSVAAFRDGLMLFGKRGDKKKWCFPGGHMEPGEDKLDAAKRELKEETGLQGHGWEYLGSGEVPGKDITVYCYKCETADGEPDASEDPDAEFVEFQWVHPDSIPAEIKENLYNKHDINLELQGLDYSLQKSDEEYEGEYLNNEHTRNVVPGLSHAAYQHAYAHAPTTHIPAASMANVGNHDVVPRGDLNALTSKIHEYKGPGYDVHGLINAVKAGQTEPSIILQHAGGQHLMAGNTRAMVHHYLGMPVKAKVLQVGSQELGKSEYGEPLAKMPMQNELRNFSTGRAQTYVNQSLNNGGTAKTNRLGVLPDSSFVAHGQTFASPANGKNVYHHIVETPNSTQHLLSLSPDPSAPGLSYMNVDNYKTIGNPKGTPTVSLSHTDPGAQAFGLGSRLYKLALQHHGELKSDTHVSQSANKVWGKLAQDPNAKVQLGAQGTIEPHHAEYVGKSEELIKMAAKKPKFAPEEKNLIVTHNLSEGGLEHAHKLGGLPAPSLAVAHKNHPLEGFGDITLVAPHHLADPQQHPVFDSDIYSPRQPRSEHKFNDKKMTKLHEELKPHFKAIGSDWHSGIGDEFKRYGPGLTRAGSYNIAKGLKHMWLKEQGVQIPEIMREKQTQADFVHEPALKEFFEKHGHNPLYDHDSDYAKELGKATRKAIDQWNPSGDDGFTPEDVEYMRDQWRKGYLDPDTGEVYLGSSRRIFDDFKNKGQKEVDPHKTGAWVENKTQELGEDKFHDWAEKKLEPLDEGQYIPKRSSYSGNVRRIPYTLDNILKEMKGNPRAKEGGLGGMGLGAVRAGGAKKFKNIEQLRQHQGQIVSPEEFTKIKNHMNERFNQVAEDLAPYHGSKMNSMSALGEAIGESYKRGKYLGHELKLSGFDNVPPEVQRKVNEFAQDLVRMPTEYFESKPQRVVGLNEFKGAVIPHDSHPKVAERLRENGIHDIRFYDKNQPGARAKAINLLADAQKLHLSEDEFYGDTLLKEELDDVLVKVRPGPSFPQLGAPDNRRETDQVVTPRQLKIKQLAQANAVANDSDQKFDKIYGSGVAAYGNPDEMKARARQRIRQDYTAQGEHILGAAPVSSKTNASYALGTPWLAGPQYSKQTPNAIQLHENNHMMFGRIEQQHGRDARKNLAQNLWHHAEQVVGPEAADLVNKYLYQRYPMKYRGDHDHEERIGTLLNLVNDPGERNLVAMDPKYAHIIGHKLPDGRVTNDRGPLMDAAKKMHQTLHSAGAIADKDWLAPHPEFKDFHPEILKDMQAKKNEVKWYGDDEPGTRILALKSKTVNPAILDSALNDENPHVRAFAAQHPSMTFEMLFNALSHKDIETRRAALQNPNITPEHLEFASHDPDLSQDVQDHPMMRDSLAKNIGFVEFPKLGQGVHTQPMVLNAQQAQNRHDLKGNTGKVQAGMLFHNTNKNPNKPVKPELRTMSGYVLQHPQINQKATGDHEAQHSVFASLSHKYGTHAQKAAVEHVLSALTDRDKAIVGMLNPQLAQYAPGKRGEEMIAYMQNFLQDPVQRVKALNDFAPNGKRLLDPGKRKVHTMMKDMWKRMRNKGHEFGPEHIEAYKQRVMKADTEAIEIGSVLIKAIPGMEYNVLEAMAGSTLIEPKILKAVEFLSGKKCDMAKFRHAFWSTEDQVEAALMSVDIEPTDENKEALKTIAAMQEMQKAEKQQNQVDDSIKQVKPVFPEDQKVAEAIQNGVDTRAVHAPDLEGKHVGGIRTVEDPSSKEVFLLKPGSGSLSPAKGVKDQPATPSQREVCFYEVGKLWNLEDRFVETYLMNVDGKYVAAMRMLPPQWTNLEKLKFLSKSLPGSVLEKYRVTGELHVWGIMDFILGNPDRHGQNLMVGPEGDNYPVVLIDHGSALAGANFDPANDEDSFIPYYFRAWNQKAFKNMDTPEKKLRGMPKTSDAGRNFIEQFILKLNPAELEGVLAKYGVDPTACVARLEMVKHLLSSGLALDEAVNKLWVLGA